MWTYFFYGTLMDPDVTQQVLRQPLADFMPRPGRLQGYRRVYVAGASYPTLILAADETVDGILVSKIKPLDASRLSRFEGHEYQVRLLSVQATKGESVEARTFLAKPSVKATDKAWLFDEWCQLDKERFLAGIKQNILI